MRSTIPATKRYDPIAPAPERIVTLSTRLDDPHAITVAVRDRGVGLGSTQREKLFEPFFTTKPDGLGLGLSISKSIVEAHGGKLWAEATPPRGTTFLFTLPTFVPEVQS